MSRLGVHHLQTHQTLQQETTSMMSCWQTPSAALKQAVGWGVDMAAAVAAPDSLQPRRSTSLPTDRVLESSHQFCLQRAPIFPLDAVAASGLEQQDSSMLVHFLLEKVMQLTADKQRLSKQLADMQAENHDLTSLVLDLSDTLQQQQQQARVLLQLQRASLLQASASRLQHSPVADNAPVQQTNVVCAQSAATLLEAPEHIAQDQQQKLQQQVQVQTQMQDHSVCDQEDEATAEVSITLPRFPGPPDSCQATLRQQQQGAQQGSSSSSSSSSTRVDAVSEWLEHRGWLEWQEQLPLEPMSSSSSSSLILALEDALKCP